MLTYNSTPCVDIRLQKCCFFYVKLIICNQYQFYIHKYIYILAQHIWLKRRSKKMEKEWVDVEETSQYKDINSITNINIYICIKYYYSIFLFPKIEFREWERYWENTFIIWIVCDYNIFHPTFTSIYSIFLPPSIATLKSHNL